MNVPSGDIESGGFSHIGPVREENQDSICWSEDHPETGASLYAVADGMGGYNHGKLASSLALENIFTTFRTQQGSPVQQLKRGIEAANLAIYQATQRLGAGRMGTTLTAAYLYGNRLTVGHVGDSRAYLLRGQDATCLTRDHTVVGDMVRMRVLSPDKVRTHSQRSVLTRGLGLNPFVTPDITNHIVKEGDALVLCSDGLWSVIEDNELPQLNQDAAGVNSFLSHLIYLAIERGTDDNISAVSVRLHSLKPVPVRKKQGGWQWLRSFVKPS
jgi:PPM family protein phosphatase